MKKILFLFILIFVVSSTTLQAARTLTIKYVGKKGHMVTVSTSLPGFKNAFNEDVFVDKSFSVGSEIGFVKDSFSSTNITNNSFVIKFEGAKTFTYTVPAGKDGDTICLEVDDTSVKECPKK